MSVSFQEKDRLFTIETKNSTYQMKVDPYGYLLHLYYGAVVSGSMEYLLNKEDRGFCGNPYAAGRDRTYSMDTLPQEYPFQGNGDFRGVCLRASGENGAFSVDLRYVGCEITEGKYSLPGLPAVYAKESEAQTLKIWLSDPALGLNVALYYGILPEYDVITRAEEFTNTGGQRIVIDKAQTACLDFLKGDYDLLQFYGRHAMERNLQRGPIGHGSTVVGSRRGTSSHQYNPFLIAAEHETTEDFGDCYGMALLYSGNFKGEAERDQIDQTRITLGLQDELFSWNLEPGENFYTPEVVLTYSGEGLSGMSRNYHRLYRTHLCRGKYRDIPRPVLINNWEATYFDFTGEKILKIAEEASKLGVEMLVLDDGWFGKREDDTSGLGDWFVNEKKLGGSLEKLVNAVNAKGLKFGIWVEPEAVNEDSRLFKEHPDWAFQVPGHDPVRSRCQLVLDFSRKEVVDYIYGQICKVLDSAHIEYMKWDMNRSITDVYSAAEIGENQGEVLHKYILGVYNFLERIIERYPDLLIEGCSGGGGRFDAGMLYYTPQIWCSDNTDAIDRIRIQYGTSFGYPVTAVGSHVSAIPNHQTGRITPMKTRGVTAMAGSFGYELDLSKLSEEDKECVREQIKDFHRFWDVIHTGDYYRLTDPFASETAAWEFVMEDGSEALVSAVTLNSHGNQPAAYVKLKGLKKEALYQEESGEVYSGSALMHGGVKIPRDMGEYQAYFMHFTRIG